MAGQQALATGSIGVERQSIGMGLFQSSEIFLLGEIGLSDYRSAENCSC